ncbi:putative glutathione-specific gamma-glutamylcyclotransferase 2 isoform X1 [Vespa velutina]|uniref:putative glutathione-specific gamma-glutamylcyclotransferase 2 isoform X1 n=1 Tax=Vespa crabro TaxID=7445 RepID=UPI001EFF8908|nr:putative glutathione-specific gamma-glutamylcyclotransferase 2 isoform X1 [Vespa crabro]XP_046834715.1 putative glutathione-specific gamma-glutamylcyclotransferase 2 isoform X1 [Vespa crabro]XP_047371334.1 putative glutathione-specific gamma-glutamylcyclotransferase 2 isoform X1 [Vespa velutina]XP_047371335.1 putative glutathione-specific gamma-glutamylcyclotransferase 2 isoform X1 [Vespa velutina]XP_047371336.1 putative glutathione-specific gamma-glutamylcyclotransferase 2 isoform X1 [Vespa
MWVFGYGSLIWKVDFPYEKRIIGYIKGYVRRFYQKSTDHRGTPDKPGRVVTLLPSENPNDEVWGLAYKISIENVNNVVAHLDFREKGGYERNIVLFHPYASLNDIDKKPSCTSLDSIVNINNTMVVPVTEKDPFYLTIYIGSKDNPNYAGVEDIETIAKYIFTAHGPSGSNREYLYKLATVVRTLIPNANDEYLFLLEKAVKNLEKDSEKEIIE